ncbi:MAG TPA: DUF6691 family protein [Polyangiaceae bacterium]
MKRLVVAFVSGALFAVGLAVSGMTHPTKVIAFLDFAGDWDPSLAFVMGAGVLVNLVFFRLAARRGAPLFARSFALSPWTRIDAPLVVGAAVFGVGWGLGGFCPGPALVSVMGGAAPVIAFVVAMVAGMAAYDLIRGRSRTAEASLTGQPQL